MRRLDGESSRRNRTKVEAGNRRAGLDEVVHNAKEGQGASKVVRTDWSGCAGCERGSVRACVCD